MSGYRELTHTQRTARKERRCEWCDEPILPGERYQYRSYIWDERLQTGGMHLDCSDAMQRAEPFQLEEGWMPGDYGRGSTAPPGESEYVGEEGW